MKVKIVITMIMFVVYVVFNSVYDMYAGPLVAGAGLSQLNGGTSEYAIGRAISSYNAIQHLGNTAICFAVILTWFNTVKNYFKKEKTND